MKQDASRGRAGRMGGDAAAASPVHLLVVVAGIAVLPACAGETPGGGAGDVDGTDTRVSIRAEAPTTFRDACEIITADDVAAIENVPIDAQAEVESHGETRCTYGPSDGWPVMYLTIHWQGGRDLWEAWGMGRQLGARMMQDPEVNVDSIIGGDPLSGIGDAAHYGDLLPSLVLVGDVLLEFQMTLLNDARANFPVLARKAVDRL